MTGPLGPGMLLVALVGSAVVVIATVLIVLAIRALRRRRDPALASRARIRALYREAHADVLNDSLTGLGSHRAFHEGLSRQAEAFIGEGIPFALVAIDVDDLRAVNDSESHAAGDEMLEGIAETMEQLSRPEDLLYRTGGDEFAMIIPGLTPEAAAQLVRRILRLCRRPAAGLRPSSFSAGVSGMPMFSTDRDLVYEQAQAALDWVKGHGRGSVEVYDPDRDRVPDNLRDIATYAVQEVVTSKLLSPVFQPIVDLSNGRVLGFEGLIRPDPRGPLPDTEHLFAAASASGRTVELDLACVEVVLAGARAIAPDRLLTLNLSARTLEVKDFDAGWLLQGLMRNGISPSRVIVELTERDAISDLRRLRQTFSNLQEYGLRLAADDVGAGNSGLRLLSQVRFDIVKIDLSLVHDGARNHGSRAVLESLRDLALSQEAIVVAEGVETAEQLQVIRDLRIGAGQGFLLGRPDPSVAMSFVDVGRLAGGPYSVPAIDDDSATVASPGPRTIGGEHAPSDVPVAAHESGPLAAIGAAALDTRSIVNGHGPVAREVTLDGRAAAGGTAAVDGHPPADASVAAIGSTVATASIATNGSSVPGPSTTVASRRGRRIGLAPAVLDELEQKTTELLERDVIVAQASG